MPSSCCGGISSSRRCSTYLRRSSLLCSASATGRSFFRPESTSSFGISVSTSAVSAGSTLDLGACPRHAPAVKQSISAKVILVNELHSGWQLNRGCALEFGERNCNERALGHARMRYLQVGLVDAHVVVKQ